MTGAQANQRLGVRIESLKGIPVEEMLARAPYSREGLEETKEKVYDHILEYIQILGYPTEADPEFKESNVNHLVYASISPILRNFIRTTGRGSIHLRTEKEIISVDPETGGAEEFVLVDWISVTDEQFIFVVEGKGGSVGKAMRQCLLAMKDMRDNNAGGKVYGFVTTGETWQMLEYDGEVFQKTNSFSVLFDSMDREKERWMKEGAVLVDCINFALSNGGIVKDKAPRGGKAKNKNRAILFIFFIPEIFVIPEKVASPKSSSLPQSPSSSTSSSPFHAVSSSTSLSPFRTVSSLLLENTPKPHQFPLNTCRPNLFSELALAERRDRLGLARRPLTPTPQLTNVQEREFLTAGKAPTLAKFGGNPDALEGWILQMDEYFLITMVTNEPLRLAFLSLYLEGKALEWWKTNRVKYSTWKEAQDGLYLKYGDHYKSDRSYQEIINL